MNLHLNQFRFFNESNNAVLIENNLSRAFALCLLNSPLFLNEYLQSIISEDDYAYLFSSVDKDAAIEIDIQIDTAKIEVVNYKKVYAVAMTSDKNLNMAGFLEDYKVVDKQNITDVFISVKDIAIVIEVKCSSEDCKHQLYNQVSPFTGKDEISVFPIAFPWQRTISIMEKVKHVCQMTKMQADISTITDFLTLSEVRYPEWFEPKPFSVIPFSPKEGTVNHMQLTKRLRQGMGAVTNLSNGKYDTFQYPDRFGLTVPFGWASELIPVFDTYKDDGDYVVFYIWPGNTKQQGHSIYNKSLAWLNKKSLTVAGEEYELEIAYDVKLSHFNKFVGGIYFHEDALKKPLHTSENFNNQSGKWNVNAWTEFESLMDEHFVEKFNWREKCKWKESFVDTDRSYFTMSLGFTVSLFVPYKKFQQLDKRQEDVSNVAQFVKEIADSFENLMQ